MYIKLLFINYTKECNYLDCPFCYFFYRVLQLELDFSHLLILISSRVLNKQESHRIDPNRTFNTLPTRNDFSLPTFTDMATNI